jgi:hypothetical protein
LRNAALQVGGRQQPPLLHFIASQHSECDCLHALRAVVKGQSTIRISKKQERCNLFFVPALAEGPSTQGFRELVTFDSHELLQTGCRHGNTTGHSQPPSALR